MVEKITQTRYRCVCDLEDCPGRKKPWISEDDDIPERCRWCGRRTWNGVDLRPKRLITVKGTTKRISEWSKQTGLSKQTIRSRLKAGWTPEEAVSIPVGGEKEEE